MGARQSGQSMLGGFVPASLASLINIQNGAFTQTNMMGGEVYDASQREEFLLDFRSRLWLTYRTDFPAIGNTSYTNDCGWGCMLRTGQMILAQALSCHFLGRDWRFLPEDGRPFHPAYRDLLRMFADSPHPSALFSLHKIALAGEAFGKPVGEWFAPTIISLVLRQLVMANTAQLGVVLHVTQDAMVYRADVEALATAPRDSRLHPPPPCGSGSSAPPSSAPSSRVPSPAPTTTTTTTSTTSGTAASTTTTSPPSPSPSPSPSTTQHHDVWCPLIIMVPIRLGLDSVNPVYLEALKLFLCFPQSVGLIGGRPNSSLYFIASQGEELVYLDPHYPRATVDMSGDFSSVTYHCTTVRKMQISAIDPSLALGFYCRSRSDFEDFCVRCASMVDQNPKNPIINICEGSAPQYDAVDPTDGFSDSGDDF
eukprot:gnl/Spiro4/6037_TR3096_c0_g1_i1.p1 gnl/Spiro4/6037_TR3096_c0_g1~~gnl/Spiro4/6037_TR3096_c0_g1_i1.p1  ORF type:complete len:424 (+),score=98.36 gnl/Spiro4/6037_TR3096_c0_g1_i1:97-1368(+)